MMKQASVLRNYFHFVDFFKAKHEVGHLNPNHHKNKRCSLHSGKTID